MQSDSTPLQWPRKLPLLDHAGEQLAWIDGERARGLWHTGKVSLHCRNRIVRAVQIWSDTAQYAPGHVRTTHYSHDHETRDNPEGVWTLIHLPDHTRPVFLRVLTDCLAA